MKQLTSHWRLKAREIIFPIVQANKELSGKELKSLLSAAYPFGERARYPYRIYLEECYAALHGFKRKSKIKGRKASLVVINEIQDKLFSEEL